MARYDTVPDAGGRVPPAPIGHTVGHAAREGLTGHRRDCGFGDQCATVEHFHVAPTSSGRGPSDLRLGLLTGIGACQRRLKFTPRVMTNEDPEASMAGDLAHGAPLSGGASSSTR